MRSPTPLVRLLVVEDDPQILQLMHEVLSSLGAEVRLAADGEQALGIIEKEKFDGIFVDLQMPRIGGLELTQLIRKSAWNYLTPVVVVTGECDRSIMQKTFAAGGTFFLQKPVDRQRLKRLLNATRGTMLANRRGFRRIPLHVPVRARTSTADLQGVSVNISERGMLLQIDSETLMGTGLRLFFCLPQKNKMIQISATVKRIDEFGRMGVSFTHINAMDRQHLRSFIDEQDISPPVEVNGPRVYGCTRPS